MEKTESVSKMVTLVCRGVALAMGVAVVVLGLLGVATLDTRVTLMGLGLFLLALSALDKESL